jgi:RNA polymerase subunit RPABC4/transcription elongation factor Spt4
MSKQCPECRTILHDRAGRCDACGSALDNAGTQTTWEARVVPYVVILVLIGLVVAYLRGCRFTF